MNTSLDFSNYRYTQAEFLNRFFFFFFFFFLNNKVYHINHMYSGRQALAFCGVWSDSTLFTTHLAVFSHIK